MKHFKLRYLPFPADMQGQTMGLTFESNGKFVILIDSTQPPETQAITLRHEFAHIILGHFNQAGEDGQDIEAAAEAYAAAMTDKEFQHLLSFEERR